MHLSPLNLIVMAYTLELEGVDKHRVLRRCGLSEADLTDEGGEWPHVSVFEQLIDAALDETGDPAFGLVAGKSLALTRFTVMTQLAIFSPNTRQLFADIHRYTPLLLERSEYTLSEHADHAQLSIHPLIERGASGRYRHDFVVTSVIQMLKFVGATNDDLHQVDLPYTCTPELLPRYESTWGNRLRFGQSQCRVLFNKSLLEHALPGHNQVAYTAARTRADSALTARHNRLNTAEKIRQRLMTTFPVQPSMTDVAQHLGLSERTLRRNLADLGTSFQELVQECQYLKARSLLADEQMSIKQIAHELGFTTVASFHRSFKRWTGTTPTQWRVTRPDA